MTLARSLCLGVLACMLLNAQASRELRDSLDRIFGGAALKEKTFGPARWLREGSSFTTVEPAAGGSGIPEIVEYDTATGKRSVLISAAQLTVPATKKALRIENYQWDRDMKRLLVFTDTKKFWRANSLGDYWVLDRASGGLRKLGGTDAPPSSLMYATFSPDGTQVAYVRAGNIYVEDLTREGPPRALTSDGSENIGNGAGDWVYEEELNIRNAFRWSPDSRHIAFWQFDETGVERYTLINDTDSAYPKLTTFPYPKVGMKNPSARIGVVPAAGGTVRWLAVPGDTRDNYIFRMDWVDENRIGVGQLNRRQNHATIFVADRDTGSAKPAFEEKDEAWVDLRESSGSGRAGESFLWIRGRKAVVWSSERDGWRRAWAAPLDGGGKPEPLTPAGMDIDRVVKVAGSWIYYIASPENPTQRYLYRVPVDRPGPAERLTPAGQQGTNNYDISPDGTWAFHTYSTFERPPLVELVQLPSHRVERVLESNEMMRANAASLMSSPAEFLKVTTRDNVTLDGWLLRPRNFDASKKYPVIVFVYGEPGNVTVTDAWPSRRGLFHRALTDAGYIVASFDGRGTPSLKGRAWRKSVFGLVGVLTTQDETEAILALAKERPWINRDRIGVWGWSGGGTNTLNLMFRSPEVFRVGVAVAPVPDQTLYDSIYQERYMMTKKENAGGYSAASAINFADGLRGDLLLVHGSGDDNVHYQGSERLVNRLVELGKQFDFMVYPNRTHSISEGSGTTLHIYRLIARYFEQHLPPGPR